MAARTTTSYSPWKRLGAFGLILVLLYAMMALTRTWTPRLGLDLRGGTTITLTAENNADGSAPTKDNLETARTIIQNRVDSLGVGESSVTLQGDRQIEVSVPNVSGDELVDGVDEAGRPTLVARSVGLAYPVRDGVPILLVHEALRLSAPGPNPRR